MSELMQSKKAVKILLSAVLLGILFDLLIFDKALGLNYPLYVIAFYICFFSLLDRHKRNVNKQYLWLIPIAMLSLAYFLYSNMIFAVLNFLAIPILIVVHTTLASQKHKNRWHSLPFIGEALVNSLGYPFVNMGTGLKTTAALMKEKSSNERYATIRKVVLGLVISLPLVIVLIMLLSSADAVFGHYIGEIPRMIFSNDPMEFLTRLTLAAIIALYMFGYLYEMMIQKKVEVQVNTEAQSNVKETKPVSIDAIIALTVLCAVNVIYIIFVAIQFSYLFGGAQALLPAGYTYAEYARQGFFELVMVTIINLTILVAGIKFVNKESLGLYKIIKLLLFMLIGCTLVMLISAYTRMGLYEEVYGYTYLRVLVHGFMVYLFALFLASIYKLLKDRVSLLKWFAIISIIAFTAINYVNVDAIIASQNIKRYQQTGNIDVYYFANLSYDAVEYMLPLLQDKNQANANIIEGILYDKRERLQRSSAWQSYNLSRVRAWKLLKDVKLSPKSYDRYDYMD